MTTMVSLCEDFSYPLSSLKKKSACLKWRNLKASSHGKLKFANPCLKTRVPKYNLPTCMWTSLKQFAVRKRFN